MFPAFEAPQHVETVGARRARKAREKDGGSAMGNRRMSTSTTDTRSRYKADSDNASVVTTRSGFGHRTGFGFWKKKDRDVTEILDFPMPAEGKQKIASQGKKMETIKTTEISVPNATEDSPPKAVPASISISIPQQRPHTSHTTSTTSSAVLTPPPPLTATSLSSFISNDALHAQLQSPPPLPRSVWHEAPSTPPPSRGLPALPPPLPIPTTSLPPLPGPPPPAPITLVQPPLRAKQASLKSLKQVPSRVNSTYSNASAGASSMRSGLSGTSVFTASQLPFEDAISEVTDYEQCQYATVYRRASPLPYRGPSPLPSPVNTVRMSHGSHGERLHPEAGGNRSSSRMSDTSTRSSTAPFSRALTKMESAGPRIISARLSEEWEGLDDDESFQEVMFEKRLWALTAYQWLTQGKQLQSPTHEFLLHSRPEEGRRILHLHGSLADGWILAARYQSCTVYSISCANTSTLPTTYPAPLNHHNVYVPSVSSPLPFPDNYFDAILSRSLTTTLDNNEWASIFHDSLRVLKPGARIEILSLDPCLTRPGPLLKAWTDTHLVSRLEAAGKSMMPSDTVLDTMGIVGLQNVRRARIALPTHPAPDAPDHARLMAFLGRHFFTDLYGRFVRPAHAESWFWNAGPELQRECERLQTKMVLTIACAQKPERRGDEFCFSGRD